MIYLDNSATSKPYQAVLDSFILVNQKFFGNPSSLHSVGGEAEQLLNQSRQQIAGLAGIEPSEIFFTSGGSEANNLAIKGAALMHRRRGNHIVTTRVEHPSVREACEQLRTLGFEITYVDVDEDGRVSAEDVKRSLTDKTILVSVIHVNNEVGTIQPIQEIGEIIGTYPKVLFHVDHVQGAGKVPIDLHGWNIDLCSVSAHKFHGLKGNGFLYKRNGVSIAPLTSGGGQENKLRSGTENVGGVVSMAKAFRMVGEERRRNGAFLLDMRNMIMRGLEQKTEVDIHTPKEKAAPHIINFSAAGLKGEVIVHALAQEGIIVSTTSACSSKSAVPSHTLRAMGVPDESAMGAVRVSLSYENTQEEAQRFIAAVQKVLPKLKKVMRRK